MAAIRRHLAERRRALGFSQETLAQQLGVDRTTVSRWERGETEPLPWIRPRLCRTIQVPADALTALLAAEPDGGGQQGSTRLPAAAGVPGIEQEEDLDDMRRRELLGLLSAGGVLLAISPAARPGDHDKEQAGQSQDISQLAQLSARLWQVFGLASSKRQVYPLVRGELARVTGQLSRARSERAHRQLCVLACDLYQLAGEICFDSNRYTDAACCYTLAASAGKEAGDHDRWACALTRHAYLTIYDGQFTHAASILAAAGTAAARGDRQLATRQWIASVQAQAAAALGDLDSCSRFLDTAETARDLGTEATPGGWLRFDATRITEDRGTCLLTVGRADLAEEPLTQALAGASSLRRRGSLFTDLAAAGLQCHDMDRLEHYAGQAIGIAAQTRSAGYVGRKLQNLNGQLKLNLASPRTARLSEQITAATTA